MVIENLLCGVVLIGMTLAFGLSPLGVRAAKRHDVNAHEKCLIVFCGPVGLWLVAYVTKQMLVCRDQLGGTVEQYWSVYIPVLIVHTGLAMATFGMGTTNMFIELRRLRNGTGVGGCRRDLSPWETSAYDGMYSGGIIITEYEV
jgi:uncharacterized membrane protein YozB (DUF420 family)